MKKVFPSKNIFFALLFLFSLLYLSLSIVLILYGDIHPDEGTYLASISLSLKGYLPYRDFLFLQTPLFIYIYRLFFLFLPLNLIGGRFISFFFSLLTYALSIIFARRIGGEKGGIFASIFWAFNPIHCYFFTIIRPLSLSGFFLLVASFLMYNSFSYKNYHSNHNINQSSYASPILLSLSLSIASLCFLSRLTLAPALFFMLIFTAWIYKKRIALLFSMLIPTAIVISLFTIPFIILCKEQFLFGLLGYHLSLKSGVLQSIWGAKARVLMELIIDHLPLVSGIIILLVIFKTKIVEFLKAKDIHIHIECLLAVIFIAITIAHFSAVYVQKAYQASVMPLGFSLVAGWLGRAFCHIKTTYQRYLFSFIILFFGIITGFFNSSEKIHFYEEKSIMVRIREQVEFLKKFTEKNDIVLSSDTPLVVVEAGRNILPQFIANEYFPAFTDDQCQLYKVVNDSILLELIQKQIAKVIIIGDLSYTITFPKVEKVPYEKRKAITDTIKKHYQLIGIFSNLYNPSYKTYFYLSRKYHDKI